MKRRLFTLFLAVGVLVSLLMGALPAMAAGGEITLRIHYTRADGEYKGWELWLWDNSGTTPLEPPYQFKSEDGGVVGTVPINTRTLEVGYIVRYGEFEKKDVDADQFIELAGIMSGTVDVYIKSGVKGHEIVYGDDVRRDNVIINASYRKENNEGLPEVRVKICNEVTDYEVTTETFSVYNADHKAVITSVKNLKNYYYLTLSEPLNDMRGYWVGFEDEKGAITMPDIYSTKEFEDLYTYTGKDLGATYTKEKTILRFWAPLAREVNVNLYSDGDPEKEPDPKSQVAMKQDVKGTWICELTGDMHKTYYTYQVIYDTAVMESCDPYARTAGVNGQRAMMIDLSSTNPEGWDKDTNPHAGKGITDAVIYELHVRDLTGDFSCGISSDQVGKYTGVIQHGTTNSKGIATGIDHIRDLGVTHVHLLPVYDYGSVDESKPEEERGFNWGYDPVNYNVPEGSYSTDPYHGEVRVKEFKQMVKGMHDAGLAVIMDVVYNHVYDAGKFCFNRLVPGYFVRPGSAGSGCSNDVASERTMVSKYIVDSVNYWADEYHIDGFRFDLVGLLDTDTVNEIVKTVHEKHPDVVFYGEGWNMNTKLTKTGYTMATQYNAAKLPGFAFFDDTLRDMLKGKDGFGTVTAGYISGGSTSIANLNACFKGMPNWCPSPTQSINYISCHDNHTLYDQIKMVNGETSEADNIARNKLGAAFYMTAQGIPFLQAGEEMLRSKPTEKGYHHNSYNAPDEVNSIKWDDLNDPDYMNVYEYYKGLIAFRQAHPALRLTDADTVNSAVVPVDGLPDGVAAYSIKGGVNGETSEGIFCAFNATGAAQSVTLPEGNWDICVNADKAGTDALGTAQGAVELPARTAMILVKKPPMQEQPNRNEEILPPSETPDNNGLWIALITVAVMATAVALTWMLKKRSKKAK